HLLARHRRPGRLRYLSRSTGADVLRDPWDHPAFLRRECAHFHRRAAHDWRRSADAPGPYSPRGPATTGASADRNRDRFRHDGVRRGACAASQGGERHRPRGHRGNRGGATVSHALNVPILLPLLAAALCLTGHRNGLTFQRWVSLLATLALLSASVLLVASAMRGEYSVYAIGEWQAPF